MKKMFYCSENDEYLTIDDVKKNYEEFDMKSEYNHGFPDYLTACMHENNGSLQTIEERENNLKRRIARLSIDEYSIDELIALASELQRLYEFRTEHE